MKYLHIDDYFIEFDYKDTLPYLYRPSCYVIISKNQEEHSDVLHVHSEDELLDSLQNMDFTDNQKELIISTYKSHYMT